MDEEELDLRSKRGTHSLFDHESFLDAVTLRVRTRDFVVSSSYLSLHSSFFLDFFYNRNAEGNGKQELDVDPHTFGDLLDMIYPCFKKTNCCQDCTDSLIDRLDLALRLKLRCAVRRLLDGLMRRECTENIARMLIEHNAFEAYQDCFSSEFADQTRKTYERVKETTSVKRDDSDDLVPTNVTTQFPDAVAVYVDGVTFFVSSSTLSLHSDVLRGILSPSTDLSPPVKLNIGLHSFTTFLKTTVGLFPKEGPFLLLLDDLIRLRATHIHSYLVAHIKQLMREFPSELRVKAAVDLVRHYHNQGDVYCRKFFTMTGGLSREEIKKVLDDCPFVREQAKDIRAEIDGAASMTIFVMTYFLPGKIELVLRDAHDTVESVKQMVSQREETRFIPPDRQRLIFKGKQLEDGKTCSDYNLKQGDVLHLVERLRAC